MKSVTCKKRFTKISAVMGHKGKVVIVTGASRGIGRCVALTQALAASLGPYGIRVNCISPGWIETGDYSALREVDHSQHPAGRVGRPEDIAHACFFLGSEDSGFITGENIIIDGGMTRKMIYEP